jgi:integrase
MKHYQHTWYQGYYFKNKKRNRWEWNCRYINANGKHVRKHIYGNTGVDDRLPLESKVSEWLSHIDRISGKIILCKTENLGVAEWAEQWLALIKDTVKPRTYDFYKTLTNKYIIPAFEDVKLADLTTLKIQKYINDLYNDPEGKRSKKLSVTTVNSVRGTLRMIVKSAIDNEILSGKNPVKKVKLIKAQHKERIALSREQMLNFLDAANHNDYVFIDCKKRSKERENMVYLRHCIYGIIYLTMTNGMRIGETFSLRWKNIDFKSRCMHIVTTLGDKKNEVGTPKTETSNRKILLAEKTINLLKAWKKEQRNYAVAFGMLENFQKNDFVFANALGNSISYHNFIRRGWHKLCKYTKVPEGFTPHSMRHTFITLALQNQVPLKVVSEITGDDAKTILKTYAHVLPDAQKEAVEIMEKVFKIDTHKTDDTT